MLRTAALLLTVMGMLTGCAVLERTETTKHAIESDISEVELLRAQMRDLLAAHAVQGASKPVKASATPKLPERFNQTLSHSATDEKFDEVLLEISRQSGLPIWLTEFAQDDSNGLGQKRISFRYDGTLQGLLDHLAQVTKLHWRYGQGRVEFFRYETRHFHVNLPMGSRAVSASISSTGGKGNGKRDNNDAVASLSEATGQIRVDASGISIDPYDALKRTITAMLVQDGGRLGGAQRSTESAVTRRAAARRLARDEQASNQDELFADPFLSLNDENESRGAGAMIASQVVVTPDMAMVTVTAPPSSLDRVAAYLDEVNRRYTRNVMIDVKIYDVTVNDTMGAGLSVDLLYRKLGDFGIQLSGGMMGVLGGIQDATANILPSRFTGSQAMVRALSSFGRISSVTSGQVIAVNGQPAPLQIGSEITYLSGTRTLDRGTNVTGTRLDTHLVTNQISVGLTANFIPQVLTDNRILLQYQLTSRALVGMATVIGSDGNSIQLPTVNSQTLQQQAFVRDGESIVLFGIEQNSASVTGNQGIPLSYNRDTNHDRTLRVILMQVFGANNQS